MDCCKWHQGQAISAKDIAKRAEELEYKADALQAELDILNGDFDGVKWILSDYARRCHDMKELRQHMGCDGSDLDQLCDRLKRMAIDQP